MREILFRGKNSVTGAWITGYYSPCRIPIIGTLGHFINEDGYRAIEVLPETVCQYTGLTDKNGTKIFEGDVLLCEYPSSVWRGYVVWETGCFSVKSCTGKNCPAIDIVLHYGPVEVIGNIHDNQELIGGDGNG